MAPATSFPVAGDIVNIGGAPGYTITVNVNSACASLSYIATQNYNSAVSINPGVSLNVAGAISLPTGNFNFPTSYTNTLAVGAGSLNAGSVDFNVTAAFGGNALTISTGTATISGDVTGGLLHRHGCFHDRVTDFSGLEVHTAEPNHLHPWRRHRHGRILWNGRPNHRRLYI